MDGTYQSDSVVDTLNRHVSKREYSKEEIPNELMNTILESARRAPTSSNLQAYSFVVVRDDDTKKELAVLAGNQKHIEDCAVFVAVCADISRLEAACKMHGTKLAKNLENSLVATIDASLAGMSLSLSAESFGLGTVMIGGMRNRPKEVAELLNFQLGVYVVFGMCISWPDERVTLIQKPRFLSSEIIRNEKYFVNNQNESDESLKNYDLSLKTHYLSEGRNSPDSAWSGIIASRFSTPRRPQLKKELENMGFSFE